MARAPGVVRAVLVGLATLGPASLALAHQVPVAARMGEEPGASRWSENRGPASTAAAMEPVPDRRASADRLMADGHRTRETLSGPDAVLRRLVSALAGSLVSALAGGLIAALVGLAAAPWRRRIVASLVALALAVLAFETGLHSVHHLGDKTGAARCSVASAAPHLAGTPEQGPALRVPVLAPTETLSFQTAPVADAPLRCEAIRGPPTPLVA